MVLLLLGVCFVCFVFCFITREIYYQSLPFPVVDRPCLVLVRHCRKKNLGSRYIFDIRMDYGAQHMWWEEYCVAPQSNGSAHQFAPEHSCFLTLAQSAWRLFVIMPLRGILAMAEASSKFPYCWPSSLRATSTSAIQRATGLYGCVHSWWKPPPQPMMTCLVRKTVLR